MKPVRFSEIIFKNRFGFLLASLFGLLLTAAFAQDTILTDEFFLVILTAILCTSLNAVETTTRHFRSLVLFGGITVVANIIGYIIPGQSADVGAGAMNLLFILWVLSLLFSFIFTSKTVSINTIMGAACLYILIGVAFGFLYQILDYLIPYSFHVERSSVRSAAPDLLDQFLYFSFVTLTTVGYGDITPVSQPARYLAVIEALISQLYLTILLARLVGLHLNQKKSD